MSESNNKKWKAYCKRSGNNISFADFCELENKYASERISKEQINRFHNDNGAAQQVNENQQQPVMNVVRDEHVANRENEEEEEKIFGMPRKVAIGLGVVLLILCLAFGVWMYMSRNKVEMPGIKPADGGATNPSADTGSATAPVSGNA